jgi:hypothetical protein
VLAAKDGAVPIERMFASHDGSRVVIGDYTSSWEVPVAPNAVPEKLAGMAQGYSADGVLVVQAKDFVAGLLEGKEKWRRPRTGPRREGRSSEPRVLARPQGRGDPGRPALLRARLRRQGGHSGPRDEGWQSHARAPGRRELRGRGGCAGAVGVEGAEEGRRRLRVHHGDTEITKVSRSSEI